MKQTIFLSLVGLSAVVGIAGALLAAPMFHSHADPTVRLNASWANRYDSFETMAADADAIVVGEVRSSIPGRAVEFGDGRAPLNFTWVDVVVSDVLAGSAPSVVTVEQTGGGIGDRVLHFDGDPAYRPGERVLLFLKDQPESGLHYVAHPAGRYRVRGGRLASEMADHPAARALEGRTLAEAGNRVRSVR